MTMPPADMTVALNEPHVRGLVAPWVRWRWAMTRSGLGLVLSSWAEFRLRLEGTPKLTGADARNLSLMIETREASDFSKLIGSQ